MRHIRPAVSGLIALFSLAMMLPALPVKPKPKPRPKSAVKQKKPRQRAVKTQGTVTIGGKKISYTATAGTILLYGASHKPTASMFYIAYTKNGVPAGQRPITFAYNGGPGAASALVDIGGFGPRRIEWPKPGQIRPELPPYTLVNNADSILASTDLVFVDAIGTGYSRILKSGTPKMFYGITADGQAFTQFIQRYITQNGRWNSPKFLLGESYGTTRSAVLANDLVNKGVYLNGVILCSTVLQFPTLDFNPGNDLGYDLYLPSYAAAAWYHHRLQPEPATVQDAIQPAEAYAAGPYWQALYAGNRLSAAKKQAVAQRLSQLTGVPAQLWRQADLRISLPVFMRRLMGASGPMTGRYDDRFLTPELQPLMPFPGGSAAGASSTAIMGALTATFDNYMTRVLHYSSPRIYTQLSFKVNGQWNMSYRSPLEGDSHYVNVAPALARAMNNDPGMRLMMNNGYYDMATPFFATQFTIAHMGLSAQRTRAVQWFYYPVGHMLYVNPRALPALARNIDAFIAGSYRH